MDDSSDQSRPSQGGGNWKYPVAIIAVVFGVIALRGFRGDAMDTGLAVVGILGAVGLWMLDRAIG